jgi:hypothetical protein
MANYFSRLSVRQHESLLASVEWASYSSHEDGCRVVSMRCAECKKTFEEELQAAEERIGAELDFLCLACDRAADEPAFWGVRFALLWK